MTCIKGERIMFMITINRHTYHSNSIKKAADIIYGETGDIKDYDRILNILGNMKFDELFHADGFVVQCFEDGGDEE